MDISSLLDLSKSFLARLHLLKKEDISTLREVIKEHNKLYYQKESPIISDFEYDQLFHTLARLESDFSDFDPNSPTARIAVLASEQFQKVAHMFPMISLDNTYNIEDLRDFEERIRNILKHSAPKNLEYMIEFKFDGLGLALIYEFGKLARAITRGSGREGEDVTLNAWEVASIPKEISFLKNIPRFGVRGEVVMPHDAFRKTNEER